MTAREAFSRLVYEDAVMIDLGFIQDRVWAANAVDTPDPENVFMVIRSEGSEKQFGSVGRETITYWVHVPKAKSRDYWVIDEAIDRLKYLLATAQHFAGSDGYVLTGATWLDTSRDLTDDAFNTITKFATFAAAVRNVVTP